MCLDPAGISTYTEMKQGQEVRITRLITEKRLPPFFTLNGDKIITKNILGFTDDKVSISDQTASSEGYERFRESVKASAWYQKAQKKSVSKDVRQSAQVTLTP